MDKLTGDVDEHLARATAAGIDMLVIGPPTLGEVMHLPAAAAADLLDSIHQNSAAAQRAHPALPPAGQPGPTRLATAVQAALQLELFGEA